MAVIPLVLVLLLLAGQLLVRLYTASTVSALASTAARQAALDVRPAAALRAGQALRADLGRAGEDADIEWTVDSEKVEVHVRLPAPRLLELSPSEASVTRSR